MAYGLLLQFDGVGEADYWAVNDKLGIDREGNGDWPAGLISHAGGPTDGGGWVVIEVWDAKSSQEAFMGSRLGAALAEVGVPAPVQVIESDPLENYHTPA